jgi:hypothetical protein
MLQDPLLMAAVSRIVQRSERQDDAEKIVETYVDVGLLPQLDNINHQIFYGRRGTGKTHVMKVLESRLGQDSSRTVVYIDCRTLGSTEQFSDAEVPIPRRCLALFRDILLCIYQGLLEHIVEYPPHDQNKALEAADELCTLITEPLKHYTARKVVKEQGQSTTESGKLSAGASGTGLAPLAVKVAGEFSESLTDQANETVEFDVHNEDKIVFPDLHRSLSKVLGLAETHLFLLVDEWSSIPPDIQPYLAEFLKRGLLPINKATLKASALEYRCRFSERDGQHHLGFELGADIATAPDLDDYYVFDRNPEHVTDIYADVLLKHLNADLPEGYLSRKYNVGTPKQLASRLFTERSTCAELARSSEGVVRDLINIFTRAYFHAQRRERPSIDRQAILDSAQQWFEADKAQYLTEHLQVVLRRIVDEVIGKRKARSFMLPRELEKHPIIQALFDARVLHHMQRGYADKDNPGVRYNIYAIDYGTYVDLIGTSSQPELELGENPNDEEFIVPFDDKRSIRRIIMDEKILATE